MDRYAAAWHIQWLDGMMNGNHSKSMRGYINSLKLRFEDSNVKNEVYANLQKG
jgi:hypothetical protein